MKKMKLGALLLACVLLVSVFTGCDTSGNKTIATIGDYKLDTNMFEYLVQNVAYMYESQGITITGMLDQEIMEGTTGAQFLKDQALEYAKQNAAIEKLAKDNGISMTAEDKESLKTQKEAQVEQMGGRKAYMDSIEEAGLTEEAIDSYNELMFLADKITTALFSGDGAYAPDEAKIKEDLIANYFRIKHILVIAEEGSEDFAEKKASAEAILARVNAGEDFDALITEVGEDPGMQSMTEGYVFNKDGTMYDNSGTMNTEFTTASVALEVGQTSGIVQSPNGFHIIKRYPFDDAYVTEHLAEYTSSYSATEMQNKMGEIMEALEVKSTEEFDNYDLHALFKVDQQAATPGADANAPSASDADHSADDGHDHSADAEADAAVEAPVEGEAAAE